MARLQYSPSGLSTGAYTVGLSFILYQLDKRLNQAADWHSGNATGLYWGGLWIEYHRNRETL